MPPPPQHHRHHQRHAAAASTAASPPTSIPDNRLGLSGADIATLRHHQQLAHAQVRSPAGSNASSQGRLLLDPGSLQLLSRHFDRIMQAIGERLDALNRATEIATDAQYQSTATSVQAADREIRRLQAIMAQSEELENELEKIGRIRDIVRAYRARVEQMEAKLG